MSAKGPDVFALRDAVVGDYRKFATSFTTIYADDIVEKRDRKAFGSYRTKDLILAAYQRLERGAT